MTPLALLMATSLSLGGVPFGVGDLPVAGVNPSGVANWEPEYPFRNLAKMTPGFQSTNGSNWKDERPLSLNDAGFPDSLLAEQVAMSPILTSGDTDYPTGLYDLTWGGVGTVNVRPQNGAFVEVPGSRTANSVAYDATRTSPTGFLTQISATDAATPVGDLDLSRRGTVGTFNQQYLNALQGFGVLRMLDWQRVNNTTETNWSDRIQVEDASWGQVPWELQVDIANENNSDLWITIPHAATDDYIVQLRDMLDQRLKPGLRIWVENSNEVWNGLYSQHHHYGNNVNYARRSGEIFDLFSPLGQDRVIRVLSGQAASPGLLATSFRETTADVGGINAYFKFSRAEWDQYYSDFIQGTATLQQGLDWLRADIDEVAAQWAQTKAILDEHGAPLVAYEAGVNINFPFPYVNDPDFVEFVNQLHSHPEMEDLFDYHHQRWVEVGGSTMVYYNLAGRWSRSGGLGLVQDFDEPTGKWNAVLDVTGRSSWQPGDADLNNRFETNDLIQVFSIGEYEDEFVCNSGWHEGDWNGDCEFNTSDLVVALQTWGGFSPEEAAPAVPEPKAFVLLPLGAFALLAGRRNRQAK